MPSGIPSPGQPVRGSRTGKPIMALFDLLGRTWALGVIWQLSTGPLTFRQLQDRCESVSPTVLSKRLTELRACGFVGRNGEGYCLTHLGSLLFRKLKPLGSFSERWANALNSDETEGGKE